MTVLPSEPDKKIPTFQSLLCAQCRASTFSHILHSSSGNVLLSHSKVAAATMNRHGKRAAPLSERPVLLILDGNEMDQFIIRQM